MQVDRAENLNELQPDRNSLLGEHLGPLQVPLQVRAGVLGNQHEPLQAEADEQLDARHSPWQRVCMTLALPTAQLNASM